ncbi:MAG: two pore domain potassium channel family protein [Acidobacteria bacterium]|nr:MAG: two pore domain potassium channel family protein [Acidobacteriota bacterium]
MHILALIAGVAIILTVLLDAFETVVLPRRVQRHFRITILFYRNTWAPYAKLASHIKSQTRRETVLGYFGPLSMIALLIIWACSLIFAFALLQYAGGEHLSLSNQPINFRLLLYHSGETFFTLGYGDITPASYYSRVLSVLEAGMGFGFLAIVIGYLPTIYSAFSRREIEISLLDARAGSPPSAAELLTRAVDSLDAGTLDRLFHDWERWAAEVLESHLSYPVLSFYRSQHSNQSWLGALTVILDATALVITGIEGVSSEQARWTFKMARHAVVDLAQVVNAHYDPHAQERLGPVDLAQIRAQLAAKGLKMRQDAEAEEKLHNMRMKYEPYVLAIAKTLYISLPPWIRRDHIKDNWEAGPWDRMTQAQALGRISHERQGERQSVTVDDHF